jgi:hypothetical protein
VEQLVTYIYKIKRISDGLYSTGGQYSHFNKNGKSWTNIGFVKNHLNLFKDYGRTKYEDCVLVTIEVQEGKSQSMTDFIEESWPGKKI